MARYLLGGVVEVLFRDGQVSKYERPKGWVHIDSNGNVFGVDSTTGEFAQLKQLSISKEYYPFEKKGVTYREDFTTVLDDANSLCHSLIYIYRKPSMRQTLRRSCSSRTGPKWK